MISVIIPAYNAAKTLPACLAALQAQTMASDAYEVILVDDGSSDHTAQVAESYSINVIRQANTGAAAARNRGVAAAKGSLLLFTDADCVPAPDWIEQIVAPFADSAVAGVKGTYYSNQPKLVARFVQLEYEDKYDRMATFDTIDFIDTYAAAYRRDIFEKMGGFDETFLVDEDQEFSFRLTNAGYQLVFAPQAKVGHVHVDTISRYARRKYWIGYWKAMVVQQHPNKLMQDSHTPQILKVQMALAGLATLLFGFGLVKGLRRFVLGGLLTWLALCLTAIPFYNKVLKRDPDVLLISPLMISIRAWSLGYGFLIGQLRIFKNRRGEQSRDLA